MYLSWNEKILTDFSPETIETAYNDGYVLTRVGKGTMRQTRSLRIDLSKFTLSSENRRVLKKTEGLELAPSGLPYSDYHWSIAKLAKDFYTTKFGDGTFSANKVKEILTDEEKSNFNQLLVYKINTETVGYCVTYTNETLLHYSYPFYNLSETQSNLGMSMMLRAIISAQENHKKYIYLGSFQRPTDVYKLQFAGLEWFDGERWGDDLEQLKKSL